MELHFEPEDIRPAVADRYTMILTTLQLHRNILLKYTQELYVPSNIDNHITSSRC